MNESSPIDPTSAWPMWIQVFDEVGNGRDVGIASQDNHVRLQIFSTEAARRRKEGKPC
jgi:hypothetical protein